jgi:glycosyltransferase involved in cell wall biosynthesis
MPTRGRPAFAQRAIDCFLRQTWEEKELIVVDDLDNRSFFEGVDVPDVSYHLLERKISIGAKRNYACQSAKGSIVAHFDDDDWSAPTRLEDQVERLLVTGKTISGYHSMFFTDMVRWWKYTGSDDYALGTSLVYRREYWESHPFNESCSEGEDNHFIWPARRSSLLTSVDAELLLYATIHPDNTSVRTMKNSAQWKEYEPPFEPEPRVE